jgi:hypothetical protein
MNRTRFLKIGLGASLGLMAGGLQAQEKAGDSLEQWVSRHGGTLVRKNGERRAVVSTKLARLSDSLQELCALTEGHVRCQGSRVTGVYGGEPFRVMLRAA